MGSRVGGRASNADGRLEVFVRGTDDALWHMWQTAPNNGWSGWASLGGVIQRPAGRGTERRRTAGGVREGHGQRPLAHLADGAQQRLVAAGHRSAADHLQPRRRSTTPTAGIEVFVKGADNALWHIWQDRASNGWSGWATLGGQLTEGPVGSRNADGRLEVFVKGTDWLCGTPGRARRTTAGHDRSRHPRYRPSTCGSRRRRPVRRVRDAGIGRHGVGIDENALTELEQGLGVSLPQADIASS